MGLDVNSYGPVDLAQQAMGATSTGSWLNTGAAGLSTVANAVAGGYQARVALNNASLADADAENTLVSGKFEEQKSRLRTSQSVAAEKVGQAAGNIDVSSGSALKVREDQQRIGDLDANLIRYNAERSAGNSRAQAGNYRTQAGLDFLSTGLGLVGGAAKTYASYIAGSTALANQKLLFKQTGVQSG